ncbi:hypothetical protein RFI_00442 [Reticulomyxa filosa]|uniref:Uncharacterized protein n=1 Tax=Reticulomyxa filosa TaxID=46433 RepID=X6PEZ4_RETFI|nr:hypothetical protein RFI_00442 [Reticulomyxa filosa]|eukprot:ETO36619.1 hypothetical protein RFI_00442 [Reticulomyxa filosa]
MEYWIVQYLIVVNSFALNQSLYKDSNNVYCVKFSQYHYYITYYLFFLSYDNKKISNFKYFNQHTGIELICIYILYRRQNVETSKSLHVFNEHTETIWCIDDKW